MSFKIGLEASSSLSNRLSGIQRYIVELSAALSKISQDRPEYQIALCYKGSRIKKAGLRPQIKLIHRWYWPFPGLTVRMFDIVHAMDTTLPFPLPKKLICTIHDLFSIKVEGYSSLKFREKKKRAYEKIIRNCQGIIVPSLSTKKDLVESFEYPENKVFIIPHGVNRQFFDSTGNDNFTYPLSAKDEPYILAFGGRERKNLYSVAQAYLESGLSKSHKLVVVGSVEEIVAEFLQSRGAAKRVVQLGSISDDMLPGLYAKASIFCFPSLYEGFGLPVLESMAAGTAVVTSKVGATADIGKDHAVLVDPGSVSDISRGMHEALNLNRDMLAQAKVYAGGFTWEKTAEQTLAVYNATLTK